MPQRSNAMPTSRSIQGKAFSWPTAISTSSQGKCSSGSPVGTRSRRPLASRTALTFSNTTPVRREPSWVKALGTRKLRIGMPSCIASSFSQGEAFISSKPERTITFTSSPPSRRDERQQSIAVLPPPSTITRLPMRLTWPNDTLESQSMPMWIWSAASRRPGRSRSRPRGAPRADEDRVEVFGEQSLQAVDPMAAAKIDAEIEDIADLLVDHRLGQAEFRNLACASCRRRADPGRRPRLRSRAARDRAPRSATPARRRYRRCVCRCALPPAAASAPRPRPCSRRRRVSDGRWRPVRPRPGRGGRRARTGDRRCARECPERHSIAS